MTIKRPVPRVVNWPAEQHDGELRCSLCNYDVAVWETPVKGVVLCRKLQCILDFVERFFKRLGE